MSQYNLYWQLLHQVSFFQANPDTIDQTVRSIFELLDCAECRDDALTSYSSSNSSPAQKLVDLHNKVNQKTGKRNIWTLVQAKEYYGQSLKEISETYIKWLISVAMDSKTDLTSLIKTVGLIHRLFYPKTPNNLRLDLSLERRPFQLYVYAKIILNNYCQVTVDYNKFKDRYDFAFSLSTSSERSIAPKKSGCRSCQQKREAELKRRQVTPFPITPHVSVIKPVVTQTQKKLLNDSPRPISLVTRVGNRTTIKTPNKTISKNTQIQIKSSDLRSETRLMRRLANIHKVLRTV